MRPNNHDTAKLWQAPTLVIMQSDSVCLVQNFHDQQAREADTYQRRSLFANDTHQAQVDADF